MRNVLFDLGGLFITVFTDRFEQWLIRWCPSGVSSELLRVQFAELHHLYEQGGLSTSRFLTDVRSLLNNQVDESEIERAWDGILGSFSEEDLKWASALRSTSGQPYSATPMNCTACRSRRLFVCVQMDVHYRIILVGYIIPKI